MVADYATDELFRSFIHDTSSNDAEVVAQCLTSASRAVDKDCGRFFYADTTPTALTFNAGDQFCCELADCDMAWEISTTTGLLVKTDTNGDGTYDATWTIGTDFILEPANQARYGIRGWPYDTIRSIGSRSFPVASSRQPRPVQVTAAWGWPAVPDGIVYASLLAANAMYKRGDAPFGVAGFDAFGVVRVRSDPQYLSAIAPFIRTSRLVA